VTVALVLLVVFGITIVATVVEVENDEKIKHISFFRAFAHVKTLESTLLFLSFSLLCLSYFPHSSPLSSGNLSDAAPFS
jgi:hypothetical protein